MINTGVIIHKVRPIKKSVATPCSEAETGNILSPQAKICHAKNAMKTKKNKRRGPKTSGTNQFAEVERRTAETRVETEQKQKQKQPQTNGRHAEICWLILETSHHTVI